MVDRSAARNQYCWIASITPRKYNKAFQSLPIPLPHVVSRARQRNCSRRDNGRSPGHPMGRLVGTRWARAPSQPSIATPRLALSTSFFTLSLSFSLSPFLPICFTPSPSASRIPHHDASRADSADLPSTRRVDSVSFSPSRRTLGSLSPTVCSPVPSIPRERP